MTQRQTELMDICTLLLSANYLPIYPSPQQCWIITTLTSLSPFVVSCEVAMCPPPFPEYPNVSVFSTGITSFKILFIYLLRSVEQGSALLPIFQDGEVSHKDTCFFPTHTGCLQQGRGLNLDFPKSYTSAWNHCATLLPFHQSSSSEHSPYLLQACLKITLQSPRSLIYRHG